jgi:hypothetical protein
MAPNGWGGNLLQFDPGRIARGTFDVPQEQAS